MGATWFSDEVRVMIAPFEAYRTLLARKPARPRRRLLFRAALFALLIGGVVSISSPGDLLPLLTASAALRYALVPALELLLGAALIVSARGRAVPLAPALDLHLARHGPLACWVVCV